MGRKRSRTSVKSKGSMNSVSKNTKRMMRAEKKADLMQKMLNKLGKLEPDTKADNTGGGPQVVINITRAKDREEAITIEGQTLDNAT